VLGPTTGGVRSYDELRGAEHADAGDVAVRGSEPALLLFTSGTTGYPKGALLSHDGVAAIAHASISCDGLSPRDRMVLGMPLAFTGALVTQLVPIVAAGCSMVLRDTIDGDQLLDDIERYGITYSYGVPLFYERMARSPGFAEADLSTLRGAKSGGAPIAPWLLDTFNARGVAMVAAYGLTEAGGLSLQLAGSLAESKLGSVGCPVLGMQARVVGDDGQDLPAGQPGELLLKGPCLMLGYWEDEDATGAAIVDGWLRTGDHASIDEDGYFTIVGRKTDMLISGGLNVYPAEIERVLESHPDVKAVAVVGAPDERWGEMAVAFVVSERRDLTLEELLTFCSDRLADYKRPRRLVVVDDLPRTMSGKIKKADLRAEAMTAGTP
jgi:fatty-acyl-CoA synthase